jgi:CRP-like cAMP-binding protein
MFRPIPEQDQELLDLSFEKKALNEGDYLFRPNHICKNLFFICKGILRIVVANDKGIVVTHFFLKQNQFCTILKSFNTEVVAEEGIQAACEAEVLAVSRTKLFWLYERISYLKGLIDQITQQALLDKVELRNSYLGLDAQSRYKLFMMQQPDVAMRVPLSDIASYLGITQQSLSRIRKSVR